MLKVHFPAFTGYVDKKHARPVQVNKTWTDGRRYGAFEQLLLTCYGVVVPVSENVALFWFPHQVQINGVRMHRYTVIFAQNGKES